MDKFKSIVKPDLHAIIQNLYAAGIQNAISAAGGIVFSLFWSKRTEILTEFYLWLGKLTINEALKSIIGFLIPALGAATLLGILFWIGRISFKWARRTAQNSPINREKIDANEALVTLAPLTRESGEYLSIKVTNNNQDSPVLCRALMHRMEWFQQDPKNAERGEWIPINIDEYGPLSWHHGGTDNDGFKKVYSNPEFINIARDTTKHDMNHAIRGNIMFTFLVEKPHRAGRYKIWIEVLCQQGEKTKTETWMGCISMISRARTDEPEMPTIVQCEDVKDWKQEQAKR